MKKKTKNILVLKFLVKRMDQYKSNFTRKMKKSRIRIQKSISQSVI